MSNTLLNKKGNISKVKYHLPAYQPREDTATSINNKTKASSVNKKQSFVHHNQSMTSNGDISFEVIGIHQNNEGQKENTFFRSKNRLSVKNSKVEHQRKPSHLKDYNGQTSIQASLSTIKAMASSRDWVIPEGFERQEFNRFVEGLKEDETYQHTITMFTIMYFYQNKKKP